MRGHASIGLLLSLLAILSTVPAIEASTLRPEALPPVVAVEDQGPRSMSLRFTLPDLEIGDMAISGRAFKTATIPGGGFQGAVGEPAVPSFTRLIQVPEGVEVTAHATLLARETMTDMRLAPITEDEDKDVAIDAENYARAGAPAADVIVGEPMILRDVRVVALTFLPVRYDPEAETIEIAREMEVTVEFLGGGTALTSRHSTIPPSFDRLYRSLIVNYPGAQALGATVAPGTWLAICPSDTAVTNRLSHLVAWRQRKGNPVVVATTSQTGTSNTQIKSYIQNAYDNWPVPPEYIVLVGDARPPTRSRPGTRA